MIEKAVVSPIEFNARCVEQGTRLLVGNLAAHGNGDLAIFVSLLHIVVVLEQMRPGVNEPVAYARALDYLVGRKAAGRIVVHIGCEVAPVILAVVEHKQAAHLANIGIEAQDAGILVQHGAVAA